MLTLAVVVAPALDGSSEVVSGQFVDAVRELRSQLPEQPPYRFVYSDPLGATGLWPSASGAKVARRSRPAMTTQSSGRSEIGGPPLYRLEQSDGLVGLWERDVTGRPRGAERRAPSWSAACRANHP